MRSNVFKLNDSNTSGAEDLAIWCDGWWLPHCSSHISEGLWGNVRHQHDHGLPRKGPLCVSRCGYHTRSIAKIRRFLDRILVREDRPRFCDITTGPQQCSVHWNRLGHSQQLQKAQNIAAWVVTRMRGDHITPVLKDLELAASAVENQVQSAPPSLQGPAWTFPHLHLRAVTSSCTFISCFETGSKRPLAP